MAFITFITFIALMAFIAFIAFMAFMAFKALERIVQFIGVLTVILAAISLFFMDITFAARLISKEINVVERNEVFSTYTKAVLVGNYQRYIDQMLDVSNAKNMGLPYLVDVHLISESPGQKVVWSHIFSFPIRAKYYSRVVIHRGKNNTTLRYYLINRQGPYPNDHDFDHFSGEAHIKLLSGKGDHSRFLLTSVTRVKFKPYVWDLDILMKPMLRSHAEETLRAYSN